MCSPTGVRVLLVVVRHCLALVCQNQLCGCTLSRVDGIGRARLGLGVASGFPEPLADAPCKPHLELQSRGDRGHGLVARFPDLGAGATVANQDRIRHFLTLVVPARQERAASRGHLREQANVQCLHHVDVIAVPVGVDPRVVVCHSYAHIVGRGDLQEQLDECGQASLAALSYDNLPLLWRRRFLGPSVCPCFGQVDRFERGDALCGLEERVGLVLVVGVVRFVQQRGDARNGLVTHGGS
ncbi:Uncharacterised protein [Mycobacteroides abscessus]|nr:Uncharacterised protein [Mycobacteroides abscessus]